MSADPLNLETMEQVHVEELYRSNVALTQDGFENEAGQVLQALRETTPPLDVDLEGRLRATRGRVKALGGFVVGAGTSEESAAYRIADPGVYDKLVKDAEMAILTADQGSVPPAWTRYFGARMGKHLRHATTLMDEGASITRLFRGSPENQRVAMRVQNDLDIISNFADIEEAAAYDAAHDTNYAKIIREEVGLLAPNVLAFGVEGLKTWAQGNDSDVDNPRDTSRKLTYYELVGALLGEENMGTRQAQAILSDIRGNESFRGYLEAEYRQSHEEVDRLKTFYGLAQRVKARRAREFTKYETHRGKYQNAFNTLNQIQSLHEDYQTEKAALGEIPDPTNSVDGSGALKELHDLEQQTNYDRPRWRRMSGEIDQMKRKLRMFPNQIKAAVKSYKEAVNGLPSHTPFAEDGRPPTTANPAIDVPQNLDDCITVADDGDITVTPEFETIYNNALKVKDLSDNQYAEMSEIWAEERDGPYVVRPGASDDDPERLLAQGNFHDFDDIKEQHNTAVREASQARRHAIYTPHQLMYRLMERDIKATQPSVPFEDRHKRAVIGAFLKMDRANSDIDEGTSYRRAMEVSRGRVGLWFENQNRISLNDYFEQDKDLKELGLDFRAEHLLRLIHEETITNDELAKKMRELELFAQDQLPGKRLKLDEQESKKALLKLDEFKLALYRLRAEEVFKEIGKVGTPERAKAILGVLKEHGAEFEIPPPRPGTQFPAVMTIGELKREVAIAQAEEQIQHLDEGSPERTELERHLAIMKKYNSLAVAEAVSAVTLKLPALWSRFKQWRAARQTVDAVT